MSMDDAFEELDATRLRLNSVAERARRNAERAAQLAAEVNEAAATARSARGEVIVTARPGGVVVSVEFTDGAADVTLDHLGVLTGRTVAQAQHDAAMTFATHSAGLFGADSGIARGFRADAARAFPAPDDRDDL